MKRALCSLATILLAGCAMRSTPVLLQGDPVAIAWLGGAWEGEYQGTTSGRRGSLSFYLPSGTDSLVGDVLMVDPAGRAIQAADRAEEHQIHARSMQLLRIEVVIARGDTLRGVMEPYVAPDCGCVVSTTFVGRVAGDEIRGTFESLGSAGYRAEGVWWVTRTGTSRR